MYIVVNTVQIFREC